MGFLRVLIEEEPAPYTKGRAVGSHPFGKGYSQLKARPDTWMKVADNLLPGELQKLKTAFMDVEFTGRVTRKDAKNRPIYSVWGRYRGNQFMIDQLRKANERKAKKGATP